MAATDEIADSVQNASRAAEDVINGVWGESPDDANSDPKNAPPSKQGQPKSLPSTPDQDPQPTKTDKDRLVFSAEEIESLFASSAAKVISRDIVSRPVPSYPSLKLNIDGAVQRNVEVTIDLKRLFDHDLNQADELRFWAAFASARTKPKSSHPSTLQRQVNRAILTTSSFDLVQPYLAKASRADRYVLAVELAEQFAQRGCTEAALHTLGFADEIASSFPVKRASPYRLSELYLQCGDLVRWNASTLHPIATQKVNDFLLPHGGLGGNEQLYRFYREKALTLLNGTLPTHRKQPLRDSMEQFEYQYRLHSSDAMLLVDEFLPVVALETEGAKFRMGVWNQRINDIYRAALRDAARTSDFSAVKHLLELETPISHPTNRPILRHLAPITTLMALYGKPSEAISLLRDHNLLTNYDGSSLTYAGHNVWIPIAVSAILVGDMVSEQFALAQLREIARLQEQAPPLFALSEALMVAGRYKESLSIHEALGVDIDLVTPGSLPTPYVANRLFFIHDDVTSSDIRAAFAHKRNSVRYASAYLAWKGQWSDLVQLHTDKRYSVDLRDRYAGAAWAVSFAQATSEVRLPELTWGIPTWVDFYKSPWTRVASDKSFQIESALVPQWIIR